MSSSTSGRGYLSSVHDVLDGGRQGAETGVSNVTIEAFRHYIRPLKSLVRPTVLVIRTQRHRQTQVLR